MMRKETLELDPSPAVPELKAWNMRPRDKKKEIGPAFKYGPKMQMQRLNEKLDSQINHLFTDKDIRSNHINGEIQ
jgi:hypothetical protein